MISLPEFPRRLRMAEKTKADQQRELLEFERKASGG